REDVLRVQARQDPSAVLPRAAAIGSRLAARRAVAAWHGGGRRTEEVLLLARRRGHDLEGDLRGLDAEVDERVLDDTYVMALEPVTRERRWDRDRERAVLEADGLCLLEP